MLSPIRFGVRVDDLKPGTTYVKTSSNGSQPTLEFHVTGSGADVAGKLRESSDVVTIAAMLGSVDDPMDKRSNPEAKIIRAREGADGHLIGVEEK